MRITDRNWNSVKGQLPEIFFDLYRRCAYLIGLWVDASNEIVLEGSNVD